MGEANEAAGNHLVLPCPTPRIAANTVTKHIWINRNQRQQQSSSRFLLQIITTSKKSTFRSQSNRTWVSFFVTLSTRHFESKNAIDCIFFVKDWRRASQSPSTRLSCRENPNDVKDARTNLSHAGSVINSVVQASLDETPTIHESLSACFDLVSTNPRVISCSAWTLLLSHGWAGDAQPSTKGVFLPLSFKNVSVMSELSLVSGPVVCTACRNSTPHKARFGYFRWQADLFIAKCRGPCLIGQMQERRV